MGSVANQVSKIEEQLYLLKQNAGIECKLINKKLFKYSYIDGTEYGYVLSENKKKVMEQFNDEDEIKVEEIMDNESLMMLIKNGIKVMECLCF